MNNKPILIFVPHYIGSLKYYEKLVPYLSSKYDVQFLILYAHERFYTEMAAYAQAHKLRTILVEPPQSWSLKSWSLFTLYRSARHLRREVEKLFLNPNIKKIISVNDSGWYLRTIFDFANRRGIDTMVLQWAMAYEGGRERPHRQGIWWRHIIYSIIKPIYIMVRNAILRVTVGSGIVFEKNLTGMGNSKRFGVINRQTYDFFVRSGVPKDKLSIVGYLDFSLAQEMQESLDSSATKRSEVTNRLGLDLKKKRITFFSSAYNGKDVHVLSDSQQYELTLRIIKIIQDVCSKDQYEILFKIHPSENLELYRPLQNFEVKLYDKHANNYELVYFTDLYVGGGTAANFIPIVMGKEAIFVNFLNLPIIDATRKVFNIEKFVTEDKEFRKLLSFFVTGTLSPLYRSSEETVTRNSLQKILDWIDNTTQVN